MGQYFMQTWLHFFGLHLSVFIIAMRVMIVLEYEGNLRVINNDP